MSAICLGDQVRAACNILSAFESKFDQTKGKGFAILVPSGRKRRRRSIATGKKSLGTHKVPDGDQHAGDTREDRGDDMSDGGDEVVERTGDGGDDVTPTV